MNAKGQTWNKIFMHSDKAQRKEPELTTSKWSATVGSGTHERRKDFFQEGPLGHFSKNFPGGPKSGEICLFPIKAKKQPFFAEKFQNPGGARPPCPPSDVHGGTDI